MVRLGCGSIPQPGFEPEVKGLKAGDCLEPNDYQQQKSLAPQVGFEPAATWDNEGPSAWAASASSPTTSPTRSRRVRWLSGRPASSRNCSKTRSMLARVTFAW